MSDDHNDSGWRKRQIALDIKAENARELGLDYEPSMTKDEALKLALEALKELVAQTEGRFFCMKHDHVALQNARYAIARAREALAPIEIKKELALQALHDENERLGLYEDAYGAQPKQEPVAWKLVPIKPTDEMLKAMDECSTEGYDERLYAGHAASVYMAAVDVAPTPPQRTWVGLTDKEIWTVLQFRGYNTDTIEIAKAIEAKLKEKNT